jgi:TonB-dependent Receptor Plug Domain
MKWLLIPLLFASLSASGQANEGELQLTVTDSSGVGVKAVAQIQGRSNQYSVTLTTNGEGHLDAQHLPFGTYRLKIQRPGFADTSESIEIRSSIPTRRRFRLQPASVTESVTVSTADSTPAQAGSVNLIGTEAIQDRLGSVPGRSMQDLVNSQPGWLYEGNAVLHPRGSEYQTQFVIDGIPLTDNRSPSFGPEIDADDIQSVSIYTAGIPAEYGRKMGGIVEVNTLQDVQPGFHGEAVFSGGSFATAGAFARGQFARGKNTLEASASGSRTDRYLNPVVPQNYSNAGTLGEFAVNYQRDQSPNDKVDLAVRHELSRYDIPNEMIQQAAGQRQTADNIETLGVASWQHLLSENAMANLRSMFRDNASDFDSNADSTPIEVFQHNSFREAYFKASITIDRGIHEWKAGVETDNTFLHENFRYLITDPTRFDADTPTTFAFKGNHSDLEQSAFIQDLVRPNYWVIAAGLRWDRYQLLLNRHAFEPRIAVSRYFSSVGLGIHFSYDRVFQTPSFENILLSSSTAVESLDPQNFLRLPVKPSGGDYYEAGLTRILIKHVRLDANYFRRFVDNYADDDQIENTTISFPVAFRKSIIYGAEAKLDLSEWHHISGSASYSYAVGNAWFPVTGGLFLGDTATAVASQSSGHIPDSQDQRNTVRGRIRYQATPRFWIAGGIQYDSGLPFEFDGDPSTVLAQYGPHVLDRLNFARGRIDPSFEVDMSASAVIHKSDSWNTRLQVDGQNLNNTLNLLDFGGLFSGNAIGPPRSVGLRLTSIF